mmetsp:Transcript_26281/g.63332  ORF Transcript_26281/g.63332 Transcript_26281/m.63332 type:complete len:114 (+) Transcript_26281:199-540(+)
MSDSVDDRPCRREVGDNGTPDPRLLRKVLKSRLLVRIVSYLEPVDIATAIPSCKDFLRAGDSNDFWRVVFEKEFGKTTALHASKEERKCWRKHYLATRKVELELESCIYQGSC